MRPALWLMVVFGGSPSTPDAGTRVPTPPARTPAPALSPDDLEVVKNLDLLEHLDDAKDLDLVELLDEER